MSYDPLDDILQQWADRHAASLADCAHLERRIRAQLNGESARCPTLNPRAAGGRGPAKLLWFIAGAAALLAVQLLITRLQITEVPDDDPLSLVQREISSQSATLRLFSEAADLFPNRLRWMAETDDAVHVEVAANPGPPLLESALLEVHVVILHRPPGGRWKRTWAAFVVTDGTELISIDMPAQGHLDLWARQVDEAVIAADTYIDTHHESARLSRGLIAGVPERCLSVQTSTGEFRVYQVVRPVRSLPTTPRTG